MAYAQGGPTRTDTGHRIDPDSHVFDRVSGRLATYVEQMSQRLADALTDNGRAPFARKLTRAEQEKFYVDEYGKYVYTEDGMPNDEGRKALLDAFGPDAFAEIVRLVLRDRELDRRAVALPDENFDLDEPGVYEEPLPYPVDEEEIPAPPAGPGVF